VARSIKKGPFVDEHLLKKIEQANEAKAKKVITVNKPSPKAETKIITKSRIGDWNEAITFSRFLSRASVAPTATR